MLNNETLPHILMKIVISSFELFLNERRHPAPRY